MHIAVVNESTVVTATEARTITAALQAQGKPLAAAWERVRPTIAYASSLAKVPAGACVLAILDDPDQAGALGYHDVTPTGQPYSNVFAKNDGQPWPVLTGDVCVANIASHELCEMVGDPPASIWSVYDAAGSMIAWELCDPVQNDSYRVTIGSASPVQVSLSHFVFPAWFNPFAKSGPFDSGGLLKRPVPELRPGGYALVARLTGEGQRTARVEVLGEMPEWKRTLGAGRSFARLAT